MPTNDQPDLPQPETPPSDQNKAASDKSGIDPLANAVISPSQKDASQDSLENSKQESSKEPSNSTAKPTGLSSVDVMSAPKKQADPSIPPNALKPGQTGTTSHQGSKQFASIPKTPASNASSLNLSKPKELRPLPFMPEPARPLLLFQLWRRPWFRRMREHEVVKDISRPPKLHLNSILVCLLAAMVLALQGFLSLQLPNLTVDNLHQLAEQLNIGKLPDAPAEAINYTFQLPIALFIGGLLGPWLGSAAVIMFLAAGLLFFPLFANGGGLDYLYQPGFAFLAAMVIGAVAGGVWMRSAYQSRKSFRQTIIFYGAGLMAVLLTHFLAVTAMSVMLLVSQPLAGQAHPFLNWYNWFLHLSLEPLPYDIIAACIFLCFVRYARLAIYPALY